MDFPGGVFRDGDYGKGAGEQGGLAGCLQCPSRGQWRGGGGPGPGDLGQTRSNSYPLAPSPHEEHGAWRLGLRTGLPNLVPDVVSAVHKLTIWATVG